MVLKPTVMRSSYQSERATKNRGGRADGQVFSRNRLTSRGRKREHWLGFILGIVAVSDLER